MSRTPGPWTLKEYGRGLSVRSGDQVVASVMVAQKREDWRQRDQANARLIAAAPELLAALIRVTPEWKYEDEHCPGSACDGCRARAAIRKATEP